ncbi:hypothetical protein [uncultured Nostoc sp.]|uniref:hypothetical protein n=1 Tax=uncultured Nostoc sp. TaxID=340711 RepID=UPI0035CB0557
MVTLDEIKVILEQFAAGAVTKEDVVDVLLQADASDERITFQFGEKIINLGGGKDTQIGDRYIYQGADTKEYLKEFFRLLLEELKLSSPKESFIDIQRNWLLWEQTIHGILSSDLSSPNMSVISPLQQYWNNFIEKESWHERLNFYQTRICEKTETIIDDLKLISKPIPFVSQTLVQKLKSIDCQINYEAILADNLEVIVDDFLSQIHKFTSLKEGIIKDLEEKDLEEGHLSLSSEEFKRYLRLVEATKDVCHNLYELRKHISSPFNKCFLVLGSPGSGKTHFCASLLSKPEHFERKVLLLTLEPDRTKTLEEVILETINRVTKTSWNSLESFSNFLKKNKEEGLIAEVNYIKLIIVIDNLQSWLYVYGENFNQRLIGFIRRHTILHDIFWLITIRDSSYDRLLHEKYENFWRQYSGFETTEIVFQRAKTIRKKTNSFYSKSIEENVPNINGWVVLDALNLQSRLGLEIIKKSIKIETENDLIALNCLDKQQSLIEKLSNPFIALLIIELHKDVPLQNLINLNFIEFVEHFWNTRRSNLDFSNLNNLQLVEAGDLKNIVEQSVKFIANLLILSKGTTTPYTKLINYIAKEAIDISELQDRNLAKAAINDLEQNGLLKKVNENVEIRLSFFWEYEIAKRLEESPEKFKSVTKQDFAKSRLQLEEWLESYSIETLQEGILEFFLLIIGQKIADSSLSFEFIKNLWCLILTSEKLPSAAGWFAASKANKSIQDSLIEFALESSNEFINNNRNMFAFIHFVSNLATDKVNEAVRLKLLQPHYSFMQQCSFSTYYLYIVERLFLASKDNKYFSECMIYFSGCELLEITQVLAWLTVNTLARNAQGNIEQMLEVIFEYLRISGQQAKPGVQKNSKSTLWTRYSYREWILCELSRYIVQLKGRDTFDFLTEHHWYKPENLQINKIIGREMQREANLAIGYSYRSEWSSHEKSFFVKLVNRLASADSKSREIAFYLIRHTELTQQEKSVFLDKQFDPALKKIFLDPKLEWLVKRYYETFQKNIKGFNKLEERRQIILKRSQKHIWY